MIMTNMLSYLELKHVAKATKILFKLHMAKNAGYNTHTPWFKYSAPWSINNSSRTLF